jgi:RNA polymerase sigma factor (sigma-70 family)
VTISKEAFATQVLAILGPLHGVARRLTKNEADAEDLVAESITRAWRARASLADAGAFRAWMFRILSNTFISERRQTLARPREELLVDESGDDEGAFSIFERLHQPFLMWFANPDQEFLDKLLREDLDRALAAFARALPRRGRVGRRGRTHVWRGCGGAGRAHRHGSVQARSRAERSATDAMDCRPRSRPSDVADGRH